MNLVALNVLTGDRARFYSKLIELYLAYFAAAPLSSTRGPMEASRCSVPPDKRLPGWHPDCYEPAIRVPEGRRRCALE